jgi:hypothetical protein
MASNTHVLNITSHLSGETSLTGNSLLAAESRERLSVNKRATPKFGMDIFDAMRLNEKKKVEVEQLDELLIRF